MENKDVEKRENLHKTHFLKRKLHKPFQGKYSNKLYYLIQPVLTFTAKTSRITHSVANNESVLIPLVRCNSARADSSPHCPLVFGTDPPTQDDDSTLTGIRNFSSLVSMDTFTSYLHNVSLLHCNSLPRASFGPYTK